MNLNNFGFDSTAEEVTSDLDLSNKTYVVTGSNSGLGLETTRVLGARGAHIIAIARNLEKAQTALTESGAAGTPMACELSDPASVRECAKALNALDRPIDAMICNAGIMALPEPRTTLGFDLQFLTNHVGHFILVNGMLDRLADDGRVVVLSSGAHAMAPEAGIEFDNLSGERDYSPWKMYGQSKLANILFAKELARRFEGTKRTANALHPGVIRTNLARHLDDAEAVMSKMKLKTIPQGAATQCLVATRPELARTSGRYFSDCKVKATTHAQAENMELASRLWTRTEAIAKSLT